ncbi:MAG: peptidylprolyl isomerase [Flavobacterium sp.]|nr:MAG: peptidylprolyl isomerase [Flavobacterium sp.]
MKMKHLLSALLMSFAFAAFSQNIKKEVLFTIDNKPYYTDEFARVYKKNLDLVKDESQKDLDQYLDLFVGYKLKINKAYKLGLQNGTQYQNELKSYRTQLAKNYVTDSKVTNELVQEGYNRLQKEISAQHILIMVDENAAPEDTLKAYKQIMDIRQKALNSEDFGALAMQYSQDPSAKENKGDLGYFTAFRMVYAFENAAYKTPKGQISPPIRTRFGYHLIKVNDIRDNRGEVTVAHIMILNPSKDDAAAQEKAKNTINDIYKKLQQGEDFAALAKQFSEDKSSSSKGGVLNRFGSGQLSSEEFENMAFSLTKEGEISRPFQTQYGWHIMKLIAKHPVRTLDEMKTELEAKVGKDDRSRLIAESLTEKLRKKYPVKRNDKMYAAIQKAVNNTYYEGTWDLPENKKPFTGRLFDIKGKSISGVDFMTFLKAQQKTGLNTKPLSRLVDNVYNKYVDQQLNTYYNDNLENEFPEFSAVVDEYRDGLLLFDLMEKEIWDKSKTDTLGLRKYYDDHKSAYTWKTRYDAIIVSSTKMDVIKKALKLLNSNKTPEEIKAKLNQKGVVNVMANSGVFEEGSDALPKNVKPFAGVSDIIKEGEYYFVTKVNKVIPAGPKTLEESKGRVINDYQQYLEEHWVQDLRKEFTVKVNQDAFENVKKQLRT